MFDLHQDSLDKRDQFLDALFFTRTDQSTLAQLALPLGGFRGQDVGFVGMPPFDFSG
jgi:hypothetical protein